MAENTYRLPENYIKYRRILGLRGLTFWIAALIILFVIFKNLWITLGVVVFIAFKVLRMIYIPKIIYKNTFITIGDDRVVIENGIFIKTTVNIPINRIQHIDIGQGPLMKKMGFKHLQIYTAGGNYLIPALNEEISKMLQDQLTIIVQRSLEQDGI